MEFTKWLEVTGEHIDPIYVSCHTCHAQAGEPCRFGEKGYHTARKSRAMSFEMKRQPMSIDTVHALKHGEICDDKIYGTICSICGQNIQRLRNIPGLLHFS